MSNMSLGAPADIALAQGTPAIVGSEKLGPDLALSFADGKTLVVRDFFVVGEEGDFSRLLLPDGEAFVTGLMGPEPIYSAQEDAAKPGLHGSETDAAPQADIPEVEGGAGESMDWSGPLLLAGTGLTLGSGVSFLSESDEKETAEVAPNEAEELSLAVDEMMGAETDMVAPEEYDPEASTADPQAAHRPEGAAMEETNPTEDAVESAFVGGANMTGAELPMAAEFPHDLPPELMTEFVG